MTTVSETRIPIKLPNDLHDEAVNPERITVQVAGKYRIHGMIAFDVGGGTYRGGGIEINGFNPVSASQVPPVAGAATTLNFSTDVLLFPGDFVRLFAVQDSGGPLFVFFGTLTLMKVP